MGLHDEHIDLAEMLFIGSDYYKNQLARLLLLGFNLFCHEIFDFDPYILQDFRAMGESLIESKKTNRFNSWGRDKKNTKVTKDTKVNKGFGVKTMVKNK